MFTADVAHESFISVHFDAYYQKFSLQDDGFSVLKFIFTRRAVKFVFFSKVQSFIFFSLIQ